MEQITLFDPPPPPRRAPGRHEKLVRKALDKAKNDGLLNDTDGAGVSLAVANAWALDEAENKGEPFAIAQITRPFVELLQNLGLIAKEVEEDAGNDKLAAALADLSRLD